MLFPYSSEDTYFALKKHYSNTKLNFSLIMMMIGQRGLGFLVFTGDTSFHVYLNTFILRRFMQCNRRHVGGLCVTKEIMLYSDVHWDGFFELVRMASKEMLIHSEMR